jgi:nicotinamide riboside kinase
METVSHRPVRVFICGGHSVGKTTLKDRLAKDFKFRTIEEIGRSLLQKMGITREDLEKEATRKTYQQEVSKYLPFYNY